MSHRDAKCPTSWQLVGHFLKRSRRRPDLKGLDPQASAGHRARLARLSLLVIWVGCAISCSRPDKTAMGASAGLTPGALTITPIPFGELNEGLEYNASDVIALADSRFLFCDNNTNDALFELDLTPDGQMKGPLIR